MYDFPNFIGVSFRLIRAVLITEKSSQSSQSSQGFFWRGTLQNVFKTCLQSVLTQIKFRNLRNIRKVVIKFHVFFLYKTQLTS
jgi:hypothetical protein